MTSSRLFGHGPLARATSLTVAAVVATSVGALAFSGEARAAAPDVYSLAAEAVALNSTTTDPNIPLGIPFVVGSYGAASKLTSSGESMADAGAPYSPLVYSLPTTGNGIVSSTAGVGFPTVPTVPGYVVAKYPVARTAEQRAGGYDLTAVAEPTEATSRVGLGAQGATSKENNLFAYATTVADDDGARSEAAAGAHAISFDGIVDILNVSTRARLVDDGFGGPTPTVTTDLGTISLAGLQTGITGAGVAAFGTEPTPITVDNLDGINDALGPAGISLTYLPTSWTYADGSTSTGPEPTPRKTVRELISGALQVVVANTSERGTTTQTFTIGRVHLSAIAASADAGPATTSDGATSGGTDLASAGGAAAATAGASADIDLAGVGAGVLPSTNLLAGAGSLVAGATPTQTFVPAAATHLVPDGLSDVGTAYLALAALALVALVATQTVRSVAGRGR